MFANRSFRLTAILASLLMVFSMATVDHAEARRGGSFGSRGTRTFQTAPSTPTSPNWTAPIGRSMTPRTTAPTTQPGFGTTAPRGGFFSGFGGSLLGGLFLGGLLGMFMGHGFGGFGGVFSLLFQLLLIFGIVSLVRGFFRSRQPAMAGGPRGTVNPYQGRQPGPLGPLGGANLGNRGAARGRRDEIDIQGSDLDTFERMLSDVQGAYGREDYNALRRLTTPEMMGFLSEELGQNASRGLKNEVSQVKLLQGDLSEAWREGNRDYATVAMRYSSVDATRERGTGRIVDGNADQPTETTELWTFTRLDRGPWQLSAIQDA